MSANSDNDETYCIFQQKWWLDLVAPRCWQELVVSEGDRVVGRMPLVHKKKFGLRIFSHPPLTPRLGPWVRPSKGKLVSQLSAQKRILTKLVEQIPFFYRFRQNFSYETQYWLPFYWREFNATPRVSYHLNLLEEESTIFANFDARVRSDIKSAQSQLTLVINDELENFYELQKRVAIQQKRSFVALDLLQGVFGECLRRNCGRLILVKDLNGAIQAGGFFVWDSERFYYLSGVSDPSIRIQGAASLVIWEAIKFARGHSRVFDFEGSMMERIESFFRSFGAIPVLYLHVYLDRSLAEVLINLLNMIIKKIAPMK